MLGFVEGRWFDDLFDAFDHYVWILDSHGNVIKTNQAAQEFMNFNPEESIETPLWSAPWQGLSRQNRRILKWAVNQAVIGRKAVHDLEVRRRGQAAVIINLTCKPVLSEIGNGHMILVEGRDITAYKQTSAALNQIEARYQTIFEQAEMGILLKGIDGKMLDCNPAFRSTLGYTVEELTRLDYLDITYSSDKRRSRRLFQELVNGKRKSYTTEKRYLHKDGHPIWMKITASLVLESDHQAQFIIAMAENINARKEIENELSELQRRLMQGREKERLGIARDLHDGPLQDLMDVTYQIHEIEELKNEPESCEKLNKLHATVNQISRSIRMICGELRPPTLAPFGLGKTITSHAFQFEESHPEIKIKLNLMDDGQTLSEPVRITLFRIYQATLNNILRHAQASRVRIQFKVNEKQAILRIRDNGQGFLLPEHWITLARQGHLGIVGARERANEVGGDLKVISTPGKGTIVEAVVPVKEVYTETLPLEDEI